MEGVDFELLLGNGSAQLVDLNLPVFSESLIICSNLKWRHDEVNPGDEFGESPAATRTTTLWFRLALIESERICKTCRPEFESRKRTGISVDCKFAARTDQDWMYCSACEVEHPTLSFSSEEILKQSDRVCIARAGYVRICAHEVLTWDEMKAGLGDTNDFWTKFTKTCKHPSHKIFQVYPKEDLSLPTTLAERTRDYYYLTLSGGIHTKSYDEAYHQDDRMNDYIEYRNHMLPLGMMQMAREFDGSTTDDQYHRERNQSISWDTVGTMQSVQSRIRTLDVAVYQRPALILRVEITTLQGFLTGMLIMGVAIYKLHPSSDG
ncbi:hypothetical protein FPRO06_00163 [Fusarium proliferatum]|nr:hypothetical protein FPRO06_00163 [Fusarium proliferatum]